MYKHSHFNCKGRDNDDAHETKLSKGKTFIQRLVFTTVEQYVAQQQEEGEELLMVPPTPPLNMSVGHLK